MYPEVCLCGDGMLAITDIPGQVRHPPLGFLDRRTPLLQAVGMLVRPTGVEFHGTVDPSSSCYISLRYYCLRLLSGTAIHYDFPTRLATLFSGESQLQCKL